MYGVYDSGNVVSLSLHFIGFTTDLDDDDMQWRSSIITYNIQEYTHVTNLPI